MSNDEQTGAKRRHGDPPERKAELVEPDYSEAATGYPPDFNDQFMRSAPKKAPDRAERRNRRAAGSE